MKLKKIKKEKPCLFCADIYHRKEYKKEEYSGICNFEVFLDDGDNEITINSYNHQFPILEEICFSFPISYCPKCGRKLK